MKCLAKGGPQMMHQLAYNMTLDQRPHFAWGRVADRITLRAAAADEGRITLSTDLSELHQSGILARLVHDATAEPLQAATMLRRLGRVSLPVGRIVEGHVNALKLIALYGTADQRANATADATAGVIFGVWGADGAPAASFTRGLGSGITLSGEKRFCSGLGLVGRAIMTAGGADGGQLVLADVTRPDRADASVWQVSGMRATASGTYDLNGLQAECLGKPGDYQIEPYFEGGTWRYSALHVGGLEALAEFVRRHLLGTTDPHQTHRLAQLVVLADTARLHVEAAALAVESGHDSQAAVTRALLAREAVEQACLAGIALAQRALGTSAFRAGSPVDLCLRDLAFFLRQANLDGKLTQAAKCIQSLPGDIGEQW